MILIKPVRKIGAFRNNSRIITHLSHLVKILQVPVVVIGPWSNKTEAEGSDRDSWKAPRRYGVAKPLHQLPKVVGTGHVFK